MSSLIKVLIVAFLLVVALRKHINLGIAMLVASVFLGLMFHMKPLNIVSQMVTSVLEVDSLKIIASLTLVMVLEGILREAGFLKDMTDSLRVILRDQRLVAAILPMFIGLLPSAGGALFSAPLVDEITGDLPLSAEKKSFINYWFRHPNELIIPIYPVTIISSQVLGLPVWRYVSLMFPYFLIIIVSGAVVAFRRCPHANLEVQENRTPTRSDWISLIKGLAPIASVVIGTVVARLDVASAISIVILVSVLYVRVPARHLVEYLKKAVTSSIIPMICGVMAFKGVLEASGAVQGLTESFEILGVSKIIVAFAMPFLVGLLTGVGAATAGVAMPIIAGLRMSGGFADMGLRLIPLAVISGHAGLMISPAHLCFPITVGHFKADFGRVLQFVTMASIPGVLVALFFAVVA
jgi:integral membrane protein (TIGR00529 family)